MLQESVLATGLNLSFQDYTCLFQAQLAICVDFSKFTGLMCEYHMNLSASITEIHWHTFLSKFDSRQNPFCVLYFNPSETKPKHSRHCLLCVAGDLVFADTWKNAQTGVGKGLEGWGGDRQGRVWNKKEGEWERVY